MDTKAIWQEIVNSPMSDWKQVAEGLFYYSNGGSGLGGSRVGRHAVVRVVGPKEPHDMRVAVLLGTMLGGRWARNGDWTDGVTVFRQYDMADYQRDTELEQLHPGIWRPSYGLDCK